MLTHGVQEMLILYTNIFEWPREILQNIYSNNNHINRKGKTLEMLKKGHFFL